MTLFLLSLLLIPSASAEELSLADALAQAPAVRSLRAAQARSEAAEAATAQAAAAYDPQLSVGAETSGSSTSGFIAGYPMQSTALGGSGSVGLSGVLPTSTSWSLETSLGYDSSTTISSIGGVDSEQTQSFWDGLVSLSLSQDLLAPLRSSSTEIQRRQAQEAATLSELQAEQAGEAAVELVAERWWAWSAAYRSAETAARALDEAERLAESTRAEAEEGRLAPLEVSRVEAELLSAQRSLRAADAEVRQTRAALLSALDLPDDTDLTPGGSGNIAGGEVSLADAEALALSSDLDVAMARADVEAQRAALRDAQAARLPSLDLGASLGVGSLADDPGSAVQALAGDPLPRWSVGVELGVPLGGRAARSGVDAQAAALSVAELDLAEAEASARLAAQVALDEVTLARSDVALAEAQLALARATEAGEQARLDEGLTRTDDLLAARSERLDAEAGVIDAEAERARAELALLRQIGRLGELGGL